MESDRSKAIQRQLELAEGKQSLLQEKKHYLEMELIKENSFKYQMELQEAQKQLQALETEVVQLKQSLSSISSTNPSGSLNLPPNKQELQKLITNQKFVKVFETLLNSPTIDEDDKNTLILLQAQYNRLKGEQHKGILSEKDAELRHNRIVHSLLSLLGDMGVE